MGLNSVDLHISVSCLKAPCISTHCKIGVLDRRREIEIEEQNLHSTHDCFGKDFLL
jgi:hypothetical protein